MSRIGPSRGINIPDKTIHAINRHAERNTEKLGETVSASEVIRIFLDHCNQHTDRTIDSWIKKGHRKDKALKKPREKAQKSKPHEANQMTLDEELKKASQMTGVSEETLRRIFSESIKDAVKEEEG